jgi:hypothetical protein
MKRQTIHRRYSRFEEMRAKCRRKHWSFTRHGCGRKVLEALLADIARYCDKHPGSFFWPLIHGKDALPL